jgi:hypothetical protein
MRVEEYVGGKKNTAWDRVWLKLKKAMGAGTVRDGLDVVINKLIAIGGAS